MNFEALTESQIDKVFTALFETLYITTIVSIFVFIFGLIIGLTLYALSEKKLFNKPKLYFVLSLIVNIARSIPFIIILIISFPISKFLVGTITGPNAALFALVVSIAPFFARLVETSCKDINNSIIELGQSYAMSKFKILYKLIYNEAKPAIVSNFVTTIISIVSFGAMAGLIGAGGLGTLAYLDGYSRNNGTITLVSTVLLIAIVFLTQFIGKIVVNIIDKRRK